MLKKKRIVRKAEQNIEDKCVKVNYQGGESLRAKILEKRVSREFTFETFAHS